MSVRRVMGTEVEYGISVPGQPTANPTTLSSQVVNAWAVAEAPTPRRPRWDFEEESPLRDARGFDLSPAQALDHNDLDEDTGMANVILTNGEIGKHTSELQSRGHLVCRLLLEKKK